MTVQDRKFALTQENKIGEWVYEQLTTDVVAETQGWAFELVHRVALRLNQQRVNVPALEPVVIQASDRTSGGLGQWFGQAPAWTEQWIRGYPAVRTRKQTLIT